MIFPNVFISATKTYNSFEKWVPSYYFRKKFFVAQSTFAEILIGACGFYKLFINGIDITKGYFAPYISNTDDMVYYDKYIVNLAEGENVVAIQLGNGLKNNPGGYIWDFDKAIFRGAPSFTLSLEYTDEVNDKKTIISGDDFLVSPSPIIFDDYRFGEYYDANLEIPNWNNVGFDDSTWNNAIIVESPKGERRICEAEPIVISDMLKPVQIIRTDDGYIYDFGVNNTGICRLDIFGEKNQKIELRFAEQLIDDKLDISSLWFKRVDFDWERDKGIVHKDMYICKGGKESYTPSFTYHGFRYAYVKGIKETQATKDLLTFVVLNSNVKRCGDFNSSSEIANEIYDISVRSDISNFMYFPNDCPQREKNGWTADIALSAEHILLNINAQNSFREWMRNLCKSQSENGAIPSIIPTTGWGFGNYGPAWDSVIVYLPYFTYIYSGDQQIILESVEAIYKYLTFCESRNNNVGLIDIGLGDWCHTGRYAGNPKAPNVVTSSIIAMDIAEKAAFLFRVSNNPEYEKKAIKMSMDYKKAIRENLIDFSDMSVYGNCQTSQAMGLYYGVFEKEEQTRAFDYLLNLIHEQNDFMDVGVLGARVLFHVLSRFGYSELAFKMITRPDFPSYGNIVNRGATTLWEEFSTKETGYSKNHHFWGDVSAWFIKQLAGINYNPNRIDLKEVLISPHFISSLDSAYGCFESKYGKIVSSWKKDNDIINLEVFIPEGLYGNIILPTGYAFGDKKAIKLRSGKYTISKTSK